MEGFSYRKSDEMSGSQTKYSPVEAYKDVLIEELDCGRTSRSPPAGDIGTDC